MKWRGEDLESDVLELVGLDELVLEVLEEK